MCIYQHTIRICFFHFRGLSTDPKKEPFRKSFSEIGKLQAFFTVPFLCLTATANRKTKSQIVRILSLKDVCTIQLPPEKTNAKLSVEYYQTYDVEEHLDNLFQTLIRESFRFEKTIIFCRSIEKCAEIYETACELLKLLVEGTRCKTGW